MTGLIGDVWQRLHNFSNRRTTVNLQWVPGQAGLDGNGHADYLAEQAAAEDQPDVPVDLASARSAFEFRAPGRNDG